MIKRVEEIHAETQMEPLLELPVLVQPHISIDVVRALASTTGALPTLPILNPFSVNAAGLKTWKPETPEVQDIDPTLFGRWLLVYPVPLRELRAHGNGFAAPAPVQFSGLAVWSRRAAPWVMPF